MLKQNKHGCEEFVLVLRTTDVVIALMVGEHKLTSPHGTAAEFEISPQRSDCAALVERLAYPRQTSPSPVYLWQTLPLLQSDAEHLLSGIDAIGDG